jgi:flagellar motility protein MotE (MotC chaperone)
MNPRSWFWIAIPILLSAGVLWLSAQEAKVPPPLDGVKVTELAEKIQTREKAAAQKEVLLKELEQRLATLQSTLDRDREDLQKREKALQDAIAKFEQERQRPTLDTKLIQTYEAMDPLPGAQALRELAGINMEVAVSLVGAMQPKKAAKLMDQLATLDAKLAGRISEKVGTTKAKAPAGT